MRSFASLPILLGLACSCDAFIPSPAMTLRSCFLGKTNRMADLHTQAVLSLSRLSRMLPRSGLSGVSMQQGRGLRDEYDLIVIGGGPVGLNAALTATAVGKATIIIDGSPRQMVQFSGPTGIFSKALRDTAKKVDVKTLQGMGLRDTVVWRQVQDMTLEVLKENGLKNLQDLKYKHIPHLRGNATFIDTHTVNIESDGVDSIQLKGKNVLIATGSTAYRLPHIPYDGTRVFDSDSIKALSFLPKSITIIGAGIIAIEYARIFSKLKCQVTLIVRQR